MTTQKTDAEIHALLQELRKQPLETEWVEFKRNNTKPEEMGEYISALSNSAALLGKVRAWLVWGVDDVSHDLVGTTFKPRHAKVGNEELENWLLRLLTPKIDFCFYTLEVEEKSIVILEIAAASKNPVAFQNVEYIRVGSYKKKLKDFPEKERTLWRAFDVTPFEKEIAADKQTEQDVLTHLDCSKYSSLLSQPVAENEDTSLHALQTENMIVRNVDGSWSITNLGAILLGVNIAAFRVLAHKATRIILYSGENRLATEKEYVRTKGYALDFEELVATVIDLSLGKEVIENGLRKQAAPFPAIAVRELIANALIHQDFHFSGTAPMIEIFSNRIEITSPGLPLVHLERFLDSPPRSRNEALASFMRRIGVCEERGSGIDKVVAQCEQHQLPAPLFETVGGCTRVVLFAHMKLSDLDKEDRIRACYLHACLQYVERKALTNASLRERFGIEEKNKATISRYIREAVDAGVIALVNPEAGRRIMKYHPFWAIKRD